MSAKRNRDHRIEMKLRHVKPMGTVVVRKVDVKRHRYLRDHGLPHSPSMAAVVLPGETVSGYVA